MPDIGKEETFVCDRCGMSFTSENQMNAHKVSNHAVAGGELTNRQEVENTYAWTQTNKQIEAQNSV